MKRLSLAMVLVFSACAAPRQIGLPLGNGLTPDLLQAAAEDAPAIVLLDERSVTHVVQPGVLPYTLIEVHRAVRIENEQGLEHAQVQIPYDEEDSHLLDVEARTLLPNGTVIKVENDAFLRQTLASTGGEGGRNVRALTFAFPQAGPGATVEYRYTMTTSPWAMFDRYVLDVRVPVKRGSYELSTYRGVELLFEKRGFGEPEISDVYDKQRYRWTVSDVPAARELALQPPIARRAPSLSFAVRRIGTISVNGFAVVINQDVFSSWKAVGGPIWSIIRRAAEAPPPSLAAKPSGDVLQLADEAWTRTQKAVGDRPGLFRTTSGLRSAAEIVASGAGAADERAVVMLSLLAAWDVPVELLILPSEDNDDLTEQMPSPVGLDEILVLVRPPGETPLILDPACLGCAAGELLPAHQGRTGVAFGPFGKRAVGVDLAAPERFISASLVTTTNKGQRDAMVQLDYQLVLEPRGLIAEKGSYTARGAAAAAIRHYYAEHPIPAGEQQRQLRRKYLDGIEEGSIAIEGLNALGTPIRMYIEKVLVRREGYVHAGGLLMLTLDEVFSGQWFDQLGSKRDVPVQLREAPGFLHTVTFKVPDGYTLTGAPKPSSIETPLGSYSLAVTQADGKVVLRESLDLAKLTIEVAEYPQLLELIEKARALRRQPLLLEQKR